MSLCRWKKRPNLSQSYKNAQVPKFELNFKIILMSQLYTTRIFWGQFRASPKIDFPTLSQSYKNAQVLKFELNFELPLIHQLYTTRFV